MYKDGDYRGLSLEDVILAIHDELRENRAFLQMALLDPDPDNRLAEDLRIRKIMELAGVMENVLDTLMRDTCGSEAEAPAMMGKKSPAVKNLKAVSTWSIEAIRPGSLTKVKISSRIGIWMLWGMKRKT